MKCIECKYLEQIGLMRGQGNYLIGRKKYWCRKETVRWNFVCFGKMSQESPPTIKTTPRWCPMKKNERKNNE